MIDSEKDLYFKCEKCSDFVVCFGCTKQKTQRLISHEIDHQFIPNKLLSNTNWMNRNLTYTCNLCDEKNFFGKRYQCQQCFNYNVCSKCLSKARKNHYPLEKHTFIYIPNFTKIYANRTLLAHRALQILQYFKANSNDRDQLTGWTLSEARRVYIDEKNNFKEAERRASKLLEYDDIYFIPSIIENEKLELPSVLLNNN